LLTYIQTTQRHTKAFTIGFNNWREKVITKAERNTLKKAILRELTGRRGGKPIFDKDGDAIYNGTNLEMVMQCVFDGLNKHTQKKKVEMA